MESTGDSERVRQAWVRKGDRGGGRSRGKESVTSPSKAVGLPDGEKGRKGLDHGEREETTRHNEKQKRSRSYVFPQAESLKKSWWGKRKRNRSAQIATEGGEKGGPSTCSGRIGEEQRSSAAETSKRERAGKNYLEVWETSAFTEQEFLSEKKTKERRNVRSEGRSQGG